MKPLRSQRAVWCNRGWLPVYFSFCPSEVAWKNEMRRLKCVGTPYPTSPGRMTSFEKGGENVVCIVTVADGSEEQHSLPAIVGILAHEAVHVWQSAAKAMGEDNPSPEFEAYSVQDITSQLVAAFHKTRGLPTVKRGSA